jgi:hypothetical protein
MDAEAAELLRSLPAEEAGAACGQPGLPVAVSGSLPPFDVRYGFALEERTGGGPELLVLRIKDGALHAELLMVR